MPTLTLAVVLPKKTRNTCAVCCQESTWSSSLPAWVAAQAQARRLVIAGIAKEVGCLTVAVVTKPFDFEGKKRKMQAEEGLRLLRANVDTLITIPNQRLLQVVERGTSLRDAFRSLMPSYGRRSRASPT